MQALFARIRAGREQGFSIVDEELERGLRAIAVAVPDRSGQAVGATQPVRPYHPHHPQRDARALPAGAA
jgi:DNA-binding IclR family transcriptional regulator